MPQPRSMVFPGVLVVGILIFPDESSIDDMGEYRGNCEGASRLVWSPGSGVRRPKLESTRDLGF